MKSLLPVLLIFCISAPATGASDYAVVVSRTTRAADGWSNVVDALVKKHTGTVIEYDKSLDAILPELKTQFPRHTCFVVQPTEATRDLRVNLSFGFCRR